jgi:hypothetical protein
MKIVINTCFGGFGLSAEAECEYARLAGFELFRYLRRSLDSSNRPLYEKIEATSNTGGVSYRTALFKKDHGDIFSVIPRDSGLWHVSDIGRADPILVKVVEDLGVKANGRNSNLKIIEVPDDVEWSVSDNKGIELIYEAHRTWS